MVKGRAATMTHDYKRHGTTTLFAALDVLTGKVIGSCLPKHRHGEFLKFLKTIDAEVPTGLDVHMIVDNYSTHKHANVQAWLAKHPRFKLHFTPTSSSWLNLVERWFGHLTEQKIRRGTHKSVQALWARPALSDEIRAEFEEPRPETGFSVEDHPNLLAAARRAQFERFRVAVMALDPAITEQFLKLYVAYKTESNFVDVVPQVARLRLSLNLPFETLHDERKLAWDVTGRGHRGNGNVEVALDEAPDFPYVMGLVRQAYEFQITGD